MRFWGGEESLGRLAGLVLEERKGVESGWILREEGLLLKSRYSSAWRCRVKVLAFVLESWN